MWRNTRQGRNPLLLGIALTAVLATGCGGDDDDADDDSAEEATGAAPVPDDAATDEAASDDDADDDDDEAASEPAAAPSGGGQGTATLDLANGESFEFGILCMLQPQESAGSEILFTAVSYDDPGLDVTQFGDEGTVTGIASISVYDGSYATLWEASTITEPMGGGVELTLDGSTIRGTGAFFAEGDIANEPVDGELTANC